MTKEELKKEAVEYAEGMVKYYASTHEDCIPSQFEKYLRNAYISSAEPREKRIADLEKEVEKHKWNDIFLEDCAVYDKKIAEEYTTLQERITKLEKENAELKADNDARKFAMAMSGKVEKQLREQLTNAKEIIKKFLLWENDWHDKLESKYELLKQAEQFLNSEVEK